jgi:AcrR family transcriptional regulator
VTERRRRGAELEGSILEAAWKELTEVGYARLTMEGVAARAHTGKQVLYRRWANRAQLIIAAMRHNTGSIVADIPDTGELRGDVLAILDHMGRRQQEIGSDTIHGLIAEAVDLNPEFFEVMTGVMQSVLERAVARGEISAVPDSRRVVTLPVDLFRHEMLRTRLPVPRHTAFEIVDEVFLPLLRAGT